MVLLPTNHPLVKIAERLEKLPDQAALTIILYDLKPWARSQEDRNGVNSLLTALEELEKDAWFYEPRLDMYRHDAWAMMEKIAETQPEAKTERIGIGPTIERNVKAKSQKVEQAGREILKAGESMFPLILIGAGVVLALKLK